MVDDFKDPTTDITLFFMETLGGGFVQAASGFVFASWIAKTFPDWWAKYLDLSFAESIMKEAGTDIEAMKGEVSRAFINPEPAKKEYKTWRN